MIFAFYLSILFITLFLSFLASGTETAFFSLSEEKVKRYPFERNKRKKIEKILSFPGVIIVGVVGLNTFSNTLASSIFSNLTFLVLNIDKNILEIADTIIFGTLLFILCETLPKNIAFKSPERFALFSYPFYSLFIYPLSLMAENFRKREKKEEKIKSFHFLHEIELVLFTGDIKEILSETEKNLFLKIIEMTQIKTLDFWKKGEKPEKDFIVVSEKENLLNTLKRMLKEKKDYALIKSENGKEKGVISKKELLSYVLEVI